MIKTNGMRLLEQDNIEYEAYSYDPEKGIDGVSVALQLKEDPNIVYKTLVTVGNKEHFVFIIPVNEELNLKKAARVATVKSIEMIKQKELLPLTGYVHGGCSPIGMKKKFKTFIQEDAMLLDKMIISAGKIGLQIKLSPEDLRNAVDADFEDIIK